MKNSTEKSSEISIKKFLLDRFPQAILGSLSVGFMFFFLGAADIFANNRVEFMFSFSDFGGYLLLVALIVSAWIYAFITFLPEKASNIVFCLCLWLVVTGTIQAMFFNSASQLSADSGEKTPVLIVIADLLLWCATLIGAIFAGIKFKKFPTLKTILAVVLLVAFVMNMTGCAMKINDILSDPIDALTNAAISNESSNDSLKQIKNGYLSTKGLNTVSGGKNVIIFLIDRFDISFYNSIQEQIPGYFDDLKGFTSFEDNISLYSRTYPAVTTMITGVDNDFSKSSNDYFTKAYTESAFLKDLAENNYKIKLYTAKYYCYRDGSPLYNVADNFSVPSSYRINDRAALIGNMISLSLYRFMPNIIKDQMTISTTSFNGIVEFDGAADPLFEVDDCSTYDTLKEGLTVDGDGDSYIFIHLTGCHTPCTMDENGNRVEESTPLQAMQGCFKMIRGYIEELKRLGVYDDSTIIITGDHPRAINDSKVPTQTRVTALLVKPSNSGDGAFARSKAPVSQENLLATIVKSAGIKTENDYGKTYFDVKEGETVKRIHKFELTVDEGHQIVPFEITGDGTDFDNWKEQTHIDIGKLYK